MRCVLKWLNLRSVKEQDRSDFREKIIGISCACLHGHTSDSIVREGKRENEHFLPSHSIRSKTGREKKTDWDVKQCRRKEKGLL